MEEFVTVISLGKPYYIAGENGAPDVSGCTMWYLPCQDITKKSYNEQTEELGYAPVKQSMGTDFYDVAKKVGLPCVAKVLYGQRTVKGALQLYIKGLEFIEDKKTK